VGRRPRTWSAFRGASPSHSRTTAGGSVVTMSDRSRIRCPRAARIGPLPGQSHTATPRLFRSMCAAQPCRCGDRDEVFRAHDRRPVGHSAPRRQRCARAGGHSRSGARIAAVLDREAGAEVIEPHNRVETAISSIIHSPSLPDFATMHRASYGDTPTWTRLGMLECPTRRGLPVKRSAFFSEKR
jgi:hypothetical protein